MAKRNNVEKEIEAAYYRHCAGTSIDIMDISKLYKEVAEAVKAGTPMDDAVKAAIAKYDQKGK